MPTVLKLPDVDIDEADEARHQHETILLVEDDEMVQEYARNQLNSMGYTVLSASNGPEALEILKGDQMIDLLFTDVIMPGGMSGRDLAEAAHRIRPELKVLYTSGYNRKCNCSSRATGSGRSPVEQALSPP